MSHLEIQNQLVTELELVDVVHENALGIFLADQVPFAGQIGRFRAISLEERVHNFASNWHQLLRRILILKQKSLGRFEVVILELGVDRATG